ncbi:putative RNA dependent RNA polymerase [Magnaporthe oryzae virus 1]|uniref:RNA-directed RNA polymerase n=1 Tax=Magnaporthe oryzae virus 1 TaxID=271257 RepID=Q60GI2_9VIRU|nr:putative RNA dependent RNA polymerase [Magnaporthe oryzae virus 1]BAD60833.1 putative RNA dependent RNA polymerase [Magnaporthe oryzae virus 1]
MDLEARSKSFGRLGMSCSSIYSKYRDHLPVFSSMDFLSGLTYVTTNVGVLRSHHPLLPTAVSLLCLDFPIQFDTSSSHCLLLAQSAYMTVDELARSYPCKFGGRRILGRLIHDSTFREATFPVKSHPAAHTKAHISLGALLRSWPSVAPRSEIDYILARCAGRLTADQAIALIVYHVSLRPTFGLSSARFAVAALMCPGDAKGLSNALKALGLNGVKEGAVLVEAQTLQGRGVAPIDWGREIPSRCTDAVHENTVFIPEADLRAHVRHFLSSELDADTSLEPLDHWWSRRWAWCVNGAHTSAASRALGIDHRHAFPAHSRVYRRMASEALESEPVSKWDGTTFVSASEKLEHGKTRAIFACDTRSYFAWSWLLDPVAANWRNSRILLDPGRGGTYGSTRRIQNAQLTGGVNVMLDYDDFNSQHSTRSMQIVTEELCSYIGAPQWYTDVLVKSLDSEYITGHGPPRHVAGTLMSGHRGTTFFNSILNGVYIRHAFGAGAFDSCVSMHTGDDVYMRLRTLRDASTLLVSLKDLGCRLNPTKQSIGYKHAEFLRVAITPTGSRGYAARSIAALASGNWTDSDPMDARDGFTTTLANIRTIQLRSGSPDLGRLVGPAVKYARGLRTRTVIKILNGEESYNGSPVYNVPGRTVKVHTFAPKDPDYMLPEIPVSSSWPLNSTYDYLNSHCTGLESRLFEIAQVSPVPLLAASSYSKGLAQSRQVLTSADLTIRPLGTVSTLGVIDVGSLSAAPPSPPVLAGHPLARLVAARVSDDDLREILDQFAIPPPPADMTVREYAFGYEPHCVNVRGFLPHADASSLSARTRAGTIFVPTPVNV